MKHLFWYILFAGALIGGDRLGGYMASQVALSSQFRYSRLYDGRAKADVLLVGNSRGLSYYQPYIEQISGLSTFNLSYNGMPMNLADTLIADYLDQYRPERILIEITTCDRSNKELIAGFLPYNKQSTRLNQLIRNNASDAWWGGQVSALFRANSEVFQRALYYRNKPDTDWLIDRQIAPALAASAPLDTFPISVQPAMIAALAHTVAVAKERGVAVYLVIGPYFPGMVRDWSNLDKVKASVQAATQLPVFDYRQALSDSGDFGDFMHPNKRGACHFMDLLKRDGVLP